MATPRKHEPQSPWGLLEIPEEGCSPRIVGPLRFWCKWAAEELWVAYQHLKTEDPPPVDPTEVPAGTAWSRWALKSSLSRLHIIPVFPDRSLVVRPEASFRMVPGASAKIYVRVPLWVRLEIAAAQRTHLLELPSVVLSNTWFGGYTEGELCYWVSSSARRQTNPDPSRPYLAICPIKIVNTSKEELFVEKLRLGVGSLSLYDASGQLWSDQTTVSYRGGHEVSQIDVAGRAPAEAPKARFLAPPRQPQRKGLAARTFSSLKEIPGFGFLAI
jgi:hypothetical protein